VVDFRAAAKPIPAGEVPGGHGEPIGEPPRPRRQIPNGSDHRGAHRPGNPHSDRWMLVESRLLLLSIGSELYSGHAARSKMDPTARAVLLPRISQAVREGRELTGKAHHSGSGWVYRVVPVIGAETGTVIAVQAIYGTDLPERPLVGAWEWRVPPPGSGEPLRTYWGPDVFPIYGYDPPHGGDGAYPEGIWWEAPRFFNDVLLDSYRARMRELLATALNASADFLHIEQFEIHHRRTRRRMAMRVAGRPAAASSGPVRWVRGLTYEIPELAPEPFASHSQNLLTAAFANAGYPLGVIDPVYQHIWMTSGSFGDQLQVKLPNDRSLLTMCHPDDLPLLRDLLEQATATPPSIPVGPQRVRFEGQDGGWRPVAISASGVHLHGETHVFARFTPLS
jgi:hypothetical protein